MKIDREKWQPCEVCTNGFLETAEKYRATDLYMDVDPPIIGAYGDDEVSVSIKYCPMCGRPLTEEAWSELERRFTAQP